jgi:WhiB family transcriptional regulator, redox-sensing transcriptional regulator
MLETILHSEARIDEDWYVKGDCRNEDPELFYPEGKPGFPAYDKAVQEAKDVCNGCSVRAACLLWAVESRQQEGVWGGTEENEREAMMRKASAAGALAVNRYPTNSQVSERIADAITAEQVFQQTLDEKDREARRKRTKVLQEQG